MENYLPSEPGERRQSSIADACPQSPACRPWDDATFPMPDPRTGKLVVDPDISLRAKKYPVEISNFYSGVNAAATANEWGLYRSASVKQYVTTAVGSLATITRGDFSLYQFTKVGTSGGVTTYSSNTAGSVSTLSYDSSTSKFTEYLPNGGRQVYQNTNSGNHGQYNVVNLYDNANVPQTYAYATGTDRLQSIQVPGGNLVTFGYNASNLLTTITDWGGRVWTYLYDGDQDLTEWDEPSGCVTKYAYKHITYQGAIHGHTFLNAITNPRGFIATYNYDSHGRVRGCPVFSGKLNRQSHLVIPLGPRSVGFFQGRPLESRVACSL